MHKKPPYDTIFNMPRYLRELLNTPPEERAKLASKHASPFFNATPETFAEVEELTSVWLKNWQDEDEDEGLKNKTRFRIALMNTERYDPSKGDRSLEALSQYTIYESLPTEVELDPSGTVKAVSKGGKTFLRDDNTNVPVKLPPKVKVVLKGGKTLLRVDSTMQVLPTKGISSSHAQRIFLQFMLHPDNWRLNGPCQRCGEYFLRVTRRQRRFCTPECGAYKTAIQSTKAARTQKRQRTLDDVNEALQAWRRAKTEQDWRSYVAQRAGVTQKLLTRWANEGTITIHDTTRGK